MKNLKLIGFLVILASSLMFIQCTSDPIAGEQGIAGIDGVDGTDGVDGVDGTASCVACHSTSHKEIVNATYAKSGHAAGGPGAADLLPVHHHLPARPAALTKRRSEQTGFLHIRGGSPRHKKRRVSPPLFFWHSYSVKSA